MSNVCLLSFFFATYSSLCSKIVCVCVCGSLVAECVPRHYVTEFEWRPTMCVSKLSCQTMGERYYQQIPR